MKKLFLSLALAVVSLTAVTAYANSQEPCTEPEPCENPAPCTPAPCDTVPCNPAPCTPAPCNPEC